MDTRTGEIKDGHLLTWEEKKSGHWVPLTDEQAQMLRAMTRNERRQRLPTMKQNKKVRHRSDYSFANIHLFGPCNVDCYFCLGKDLEKTFSKYDHTKTHFADFRNFDTFLHNVEALGIKKVYLTGQNTDALVYKYVGELADFMKSRSIGFGIRTNGFLALKKMEEINKCTLSVHYSIHSLRQETQQKILGRPDIPSWEDIVCLTNGPRIKIAIVLTRHNVGEIWEILSFLEPYRDRIDYVQIRKVCTDNRYDELEEDMLLFESFERKLIKSYDSIGSFETAKEYKINGLRVSLWRTVGTTVNSLNYFTDGTISGDYFVIEGYSLANGLRLGVAK